MMIDGHGPGIADHVDDRRVRVDLGDVGQACSQRRVSFIATSGPACQEVVSSPGRDRGSGRRSLTEGLRGPPQLKSSAWSQG